MPVYHAHYAVVYFRTYAITADTLEQAKEIAEYDDTDDLNEIDTNFESEDFQFVEEAKVSGP